MEFQAYHCPYCGFQVSYNPDYGMSYCYECGSPVGDWEMLTEEEAQALFYEDMVLDIGPVVRNTCADVAAFMFKLIVLTIMVMILFI
jgi:hypothetical protein